MIILILMYPILWFTTDVGREESPEKAESFCGWKEKKFEEKVSGRFKNFQVAEVLPDFGTIDFSYSCPWRILQHSIVFITVMKIRCISVPCLIEGKSRKS